MARFLLLSCMLFSFLGCGLQEGNDNVDQVRKFEPVSISEADYKHVEKVCDALKEKEAVLQYFVDNRQPFAFNYGEKKCTDEKIAVMDPVSVRIKNNAQDFQFDAQGGKFGYTNVETSKVGLMVDVCNNLAAKVSPILGASGSAIWFAPINASRHCEATADATCMLIEFGRKYDDKGNYRIHTREWVKFVIARGDRQGFFTERKTFSTIACPEGTQMEKAAISI